MQLIINGQGALVCKFGSTSGPASCGGGSAAVAAGSTAILRVLPPDGATYAGANVLVNFSCQATN